MKDSKPLVTVLMPVYNGEKYVQQAIESILNQTFEDFEFLIIDDGSTDNGVNIINSFSDSRIRLILNKKNLKLIDTLNNGILLSKGEYIARMDCDDISVNNRLEKQVNFLNKNSEISICGSWLSLIGERTGEIWKTPEKHEEIKCRLLFNPAVWHATVVYRKSIFEKYNLYYDKVYEHAEDYNLWVSAIDYVKIYNIQEVLYKCRLHSSKVSKVYSDIQRSNSNLIRLNLIHKLGLTTTKEEERLHSLISNWEFKVSRDYIRKSEQWLKKIKKANDEIAYFNKSLFNNFISDKWYLICNNLTELGIWLWKFFKSSTLSNDIGFNVTENVKFFTKCLIKRKRKGNA